MPAPPSTAAGQATVTMRGIGGGALADSGIKGPGGSVNEDAVGRQEMNDEEILDALLPSVHCDETYPIDGEYDKKVSLVLVFLCSFVGHVTDCALMLVLYRSKN